MSQYFKELDNFMRNHGGTLDAWTDDPYYEDHASNILEKFSESDWRLLAVVWQHRNEEWHYQLTRLICNTPSCERAIPILLDMCFSENHEIALDAAQCLREFDKDKILPNSSHRTLLTVYEFLKNKGSSAYNKTVMGSLRDYIINADRYISKLKE